MRGWKPWKWCENSAVTETEVTLHCPRVCNFAPLKRSVKWRRSLVSSILDSCTTTSLLHRIAQGMHRHEGWHSDEVLSFTSVPTCVLLASCPRKRRAQCSPPISTTRIRTTTCSSSARFTATAPTSVTRLDFGLWCGYSDDRIVL